MVIGRGEVWWADLGAPDGSEPGYRRPVIIIQSDAFNRSRLRTAIAIGLTTTSPSSARPQLIADNACAHLFVLGPPADTDWRALDLVEHRAVAAAGDLTREGRGANVLGDPRVALAWLVNELSGLGITLKAGEVVTTGTCLVPLPIEPGVEVTADFGVLGRVSARIV